jgi:hypothetical protein
METHWVPGETPTQPSSRDRASSTSEVSAAVLLIGSRVAAVKSDGLKCLYTQHQSSPARHRACFHQRNTLEPPSTHRIYTRLSESYETRHAHLLSFSERDVSSFVDSVRPVFSVSRGLVVDVCLVVLLMKTDSFNLLLQCLSHPPRLQRLCTLSERCVLAEASPASCSR